MIVSRNCPMRKEAEYETARIVDPERKGEKVRVRTRGEECEILGKEVASMLARWDSESK